MDWDLWESTYNQDTFGSDDSLCGWKFDFFSHRYDVIEENALNEKSCIQVLRKLIAKADEEIYELEQNLVSLQTELACTEIEEWPEICCNALREKINGLDESVRCLRNKSENITDLQLLVPMERAENIEDILKALLRKQFLQQDKQPPELINMDMKSDASADAVERSEGLEQRVLEYVITIKEEPGETNTLVETCSRTNSSSDHLEDKTNLPEVVKAALTNTMDSCPVSLILVDGSSDEKEKMVMIESSEVTKVIEEEPISKDEKPVESESLEHEGNRSLEPVEFIVKVPSSTSFRFSDDCVSVVKNLCRLNMKVNRSVQLDMKEDSAATSDLHPESNQARERIDKPVNDVLEEHTILATFIETAAASAGNPIMKSKSSISRDGDLDKKIAELKRKNFRKEGIGERKIGKNTVETERLMELEIESQKPGAVLYKSSVTLGQKPQNLTTMGNFHPDSEKAEPMVGKPKVDESQMGIAGFKNSHFCHKPQSSRPNMKSQPDSKIKGHGFPPTKRKRNSSSQTPKSDTSEDSDRLNGILVRNSKKLALPNSFGREQVSSLAIITHPLAQPLADLKFPGPLGNGDSGGKNNPDAIAVVPLRSDGSNLQQMKVPELKVFAKEINLGGCSKLKKSELIEKIKAKQEEMSRI